MAGVLDLPIEQYSKFNRVFTYSIDGVLVDLTGYTFIAQIRDLEDRLQVSFTCTGGGALGTIEIELTSAQTARLKTGRWDLVLIPSGGEPSRLLMGAITISPGVSRNGI